MSDRPTRCLATLLGLVLMSCLGSACSAQTLAQPLEPSRGDRPNIVILMADDMGWGSLDFPVPLGLSADGQPINFEGTALWQTPNLRAMADNALVFGRMYSQSPVCSPTRASVMTGRSPERIGVHNANAGRLENREVTLAEYAHALGYTTGFFGKWHLGVFTRDVRDANRGGRPNCHAHYATPLMQGFDIEYATESKTSTYDPGVSGLTADTRYWTGPGSFIPLDAQELRGDDSALLVREANAFIRQAAQTDQPFLTVVWFHTPHKPLNTPGNEDVDNLAAYRFAIQDLDTAVGQVRQTLRELGLADNTIVFFTADNGPEDDQDYCEDTLRANKRELYEGGVRVPGLIEWPTRIEPGTTLTPMVTTDYLPTLLDIWGIDAVDDRPLDGTSMTNTLFNDRLASRDAAIYFKLRNTQSVMSDDGRYKLITTNGGRAWELYDIVTDYEESAPLLTTATLASADAEHHAIYDTLLQRYTDWQASVQHSLSNGITGDYETRIESSAGVTIRTEPPASLQPDDEQSNTPTLYLEQQHAALTEAMQALLPEGQDARIVNSYLLHFSPVRFTESPRVVLRFDDPVVAVITDNPGLAATDSLSFGDPVFDLFARRCFETGDEYTVSEDRRTVTLSFSASDDAQGLDQVRILTRSALNPPAADTAADQ